MRKTLSFLALALAVFVAAANLTKAQSIMDGLRLETLHISTNREVTLRIPGETNRLIRLDVCDHVSDWERMTTLQGTGVLSHVDSATPFKEQRFYRAEQLFDTNIIAGDHLSTTNGEILVRPVNHASFVLQWNDMMIYNDPVTATRFRPFPKANLILVSHEHGDHFDASAINTVRSTNFVIVGPRSVFNGLSTVLRSNTVVLTNGASAVVLGIEIQAVPAYNANHTKGAGNGYILTIGGKRIYISGDTGDQAEIRALADIDVAFLCMNTPFTMSVTSAANVLKNIKPAVVYPYHFRNDNGTFANFVTLKRLLGTEDKIDVRVRKWY
jgi:L-ascorbate metabolism protein UlaG (beta-lactamase superfamily)